MRRKFRPAEWTRVKYLTVALVLVTVFLAFVIPAAVFSQPEVSGTPEVFCLFALLGLVPFLILLVIYRCPACGGWPGSALFTLFPRYCVNCGALLG